MYPTRQKRLPLIQARRRTRNVTLGIDPFPFGRRHVVTRCSVQVRRLPVERARHDPCPLRSPGLRHLLPFARVTSFGSRAPSRCHGRRAMKNRPLHLSRAHRRLPWRSFQALQQQLHPIRPMEEEAFVASALAADVAAITTALASVATRRTSCFKRPRLRSSRTRAPKIRSVSSPAAAATPRKLCTLDRSTSVLRGEKAPDDELGPMGLL